MGAFLGPLLAIVLMWLTASHFQTVFWVAVLPAFVAVYILIAFVREPETPATTRPVRSPLALHELARLGPAYWRLIGLATLFTLARFSEAFLLLRAQDMGLAPLWAPAVLVLMALAYSLSAYPRGAVGPRGPPRRADDRAGAAGRRRPAAGPAAGLDRAGHGGGCLGPAPGLQPRHLCRHDRRQRPSELRGTAFGLFNLLTGVALLVASVVAGLLWDGVGFKATFLLGAACAGGTLIGVVLLRSGPITGNPN